MFEGIGAKLFSSVVSLSLLLFSSFQGNDPYFTSVTVQKTGSYVYLSGSLHSAFENDFPSIFSSGAQIPVHFALSVRQGSKTLAQRRFTHSVSFDTMTGTYEVYKSGGAQSFQSDKVEEIIAEVARFRFGIPYQPSWGEVNIRIEASLPKVNFRELNKEVDLMVLWKHQKPSTKVVVDLRKAQ